MDLEIKYTNGSMVIHLEAFLSCRSISRVKGLVKLIRKSYTPEVLDRLKEFVEQQLKQFEVGMKEDAGLITGYQSRLKRSQEQLDAYLPRREYYKRNSEDWQKHNELVKQYRQEVKEIKAQIRSRNLDFNNCIKNKAFYEKVLETIS